MTEDHASVRAEVAAITDALQVMSRIQGAASADISARLAKLERRPTIRSEDMVQIRLLVEHAPAIISEAKYNRAMQIVFTPWKKAIIAMAAFVVTTGAVVATLAAFWDRITG